MKHFLSPSRFPDPREASPDGILAFGADLSPETLLDAYAHGIFPWPIRGLPLPWFCPSERGILEFPDLHIPRSLERLRRRSSFRFTIDQAFEQVIRACAGSQRPPIDGRPQGTWITAPMRKAYVELHRLGHAHSVEAWDGDQLAGGLYGVDAGGVFAGESMFFTKPGASKLALLHLVETLQSRGATWMDIQMVTPHMAALGARLIGKEAFLEKLARTQALGLRLF